MVFEWTLRFLQQEGEEAASAGLSPAEGAGLQQKRFPSRARRTSRGWASAPGSSLEVLFKLQALRVGWRLLSSRTMCSGSGIGQHSEILCSASSDRHGSPLHNCSPEVDNANTDTPECTSRASLPRWEAELPHLSPQECSHSISSYSYSALHCVATPGHSETFYIIPQDSGSKHTGRASQTLISELLSYLVWQLVFLLLFSKPFCHPQQ